MSALQKPQALVLEIGPGIGIFAEACTRMKYSYVAIEFNKGLVRELAVKYQLVCGFVPPLPIKNEIVDVIVADQVVEHMPTFREALGLLSECHRALKPSGFLVLGFPDYARMNGLAFYDGDYSHSFLTTKNRIEQIFRDIAFKPLRVIQFSGSISNPILRLFLDFTMLVLYARPTHLIMDALGAGDFLYKFRKTFCASTVIFAQKSPVP